MRGRRIILGAMLAAVVLCLALMPPFKATLFALQWKNQAREVTHEDVT